MPTTQIILFLAMQLKTCPLTSFKLPKPSTYKSNSHCCFKCIAITQQDPPPPQKKMAGKKHIHKKSWRILKHISQGLNQVSKWRLKLALKSAETISLEKAFCLGISVWARYKDIKKELNWETLPKEIYSNWLQI